MPALKAGCISVLRMHHNNACQVNQQTVLHDTGPMMCTNTCDLRQGSSHDMLCWLQWQAPGMEAGRCWLATWYNHSTPCSAALYAWCLYKNASCTDAIHDILQELQQPDRICASTGIAHRFQISPWLMTEQSQSCPTWPLSKHIALGRDLHSELKSYLGWWQCEASHAPLGCWVSALLWRRMLASTWGDVDVVPLTLFGHGWGQAAGQAHGPCQVDLNILLPLIWVTWRHRQQWQLLIIIMLILIIIIIMMTTT